MGKVDLAHITPLPHCVSHIRIAFTGLGADFVMLCRTQDFGQPVAAREEAFGLLCHLALLQVVDELRGPFAPCFAHCIQNACLGHLHPQTRRADHLRVLRTL